MNITTSDPKDYPLPLDYFIRRYNVSRTTMWRWRKRGLPMLQVGGKLFCRESDFVRWIESSGKMPSTMEVTNE